MAGAVASSAAKRAGRIRTDTVELPSRREVRLAREQGSANLSKMRGWEVLLCCSDPPNAGKASGGSTAGWLLQRDAVVAEAVVGFADVLDLDALDVADLVLGFGAGLEHHGSVGERRERPVAVGRRVDRAGVVDVAHDDVAVGVGTGEDDGLAVGTREESAAAGAVVVGRNNELGG